MVRTMKCAATIACLWLLAASATAQRTASDPADLAMEGARILYHASGGLAGIDETLRVYDDGVVMYSFDRSKGGKSYVVSIQVPPTEVRALKSLFVATDFPSMPKSLESKDPVMDGVDFVVMAELLNGSVKATRSETGADEPRGFRMIREALQRLVADVRSTEIVRFSGFGGQPGTEKVFSLLADGRFRWEVRRDGEPTYWHEGRLTMSEREAVLQAVGAFDFSKRPLCSGVHADGPEYEVAVLGSGLELRALHFSAQDDDAALAPLKHAVEMVEGWVARIDL